MEAEKLLTPKEFNALLKAAKEITMSGASRSWWPEPVFDRAR